MLRAFTIKLVPYSSVIRPTRSFSASSIRNGLKVGLEGTAIGLTQSLKVLGDDHVNHVIKVSFQNITKLAQ